MPSTPASLDIRIWAPIWQVPSGALGVIFNSLTTLINPTALHKEEKQRSCLHGGGSIAGSSSGTRASIFLGFFFFSPSLNYLSFIWNESPECFDRSPWNGFWEIEVFHLNFKRIWCHPSCRLGLSQQEGAGTKLKDSAVLSRSCWDERTTKHFYFSHCTPSQVLSQLKAGRTAKRYQEESASEQHTFETDKSHNS